MTEMCDKIGGYYRRYLSRGNVPESIAHCFQYDMYWSYEIPVQEYLSILDNVSNLVSRGCWRELHEHVL